MGRLNQTIERLYRLVDNSRGQVVKARRAWDRMAVARRNLLKRLDRFKRKPPE